MEVKMETHEFVGAWRLVSETEAGADGIVYLPRGEQPPGLLIYQADGVMTVQLMRRERSGDVRDLATALDQYLGYYGRYTVDWMARTVTHHLEGCSYSAWIGTDLLRHFEFAGRRLTLTAEVVKASAALTRVLVWERVES